MNRYAFRRAARNRAVPADVVGQELSRIWEKSGHVLEPKQVVEEARPPAAPLHPAFEWNDAKAAEEYRLWQARNLIKSVVVVAESGETEPLFFHVESEPPRAHYYQTGTALKVSPVEYFSALTYAKGKLDAAAASFEEIRQLLQKDGRGDGELSKIGAILEALATAKKVASTLQ